MMTCTIWSALIEWFSPNALQRDEKILYTSEHSNFDVTHQGKSKVTNVSNFKSVGFGLKT